MYKTKKVDDKLYLFKGENQIGEISPDALSYVKEGDEFDEEQLRVQQIGPHSDMDDVFSIKASFRDTADYKHYIQIKGSCNHFH